MKKVAILLPCYNEEDGVAAVIKGFNRKQLKSLGYELDIIVIDNNSSDRTQEVARKAGARVIFEPEQGKGNAIRTGFYSITEDTDYVAMLDGDDTYKPKELARLLEPLSSGFSDVIIGSRLGGKIKDGSMRGFNRLGNWMFSFLTRTTYKVNVTDVLTGYFAWTREAAIKLRPHLNSKGFSIEMEMITKMARLGLEVYSVPISYEPRLGESSLRPIHDGIRILREYFRQLIWYPSTTKIVFVSDGVYPYNKGGKEKRLYEITKRLARDGKDIHVYTMKWWEEDSDVITIEGVKYHALCKLYPMYHNDNRSIKQAVMFGLSCFKLIKVKFDVIDVDHMPFFPLFAVRIICWVRFRKMYATWLEVWGKEYWRSYMGAGGFIASIIEKISFLLPNTIISISQHTTDKLIEFGCKKRIITVPLGVDQELIFASPAAHMKSDVIYTGRLLKHKNVDVLITAIANVKKTNEKINCLIIGEGPTRKALEQQVINLKLERNVHFLNFVDEHGELLGIIKSSKVFVLPSDREGFGLVVAEANACGLPVLTLNHKNNAATSLIEPGRNGDLFSGHQDLAKKIRHYVYDVHDRNYDYSDILSRYSWEAGVKSMLKGYNKK